jgi:hypothetical protein
MDNAQDALAKGKLFAPFLNVTEYCFEDVSDNIRIRINKYVGNFKNTKNRIKKKTRITIAESINFFLIITHPRVIYSHRLSNHTYMLTQQQFANYL